MFVPVADDTEGNLFFVGVILRFSDHPGEEIELSLSGLFAPTPFFLLILFQQRFVDIRDGNGVFESVHLPKVPADNVGRLFKRLVQRFLAELIDIMVVEIEEQVLASQQQVVTLPLVAVDALERILGPFEPLAGSVCILGDDA